MYLMKRNTVKLTPGFIRALVSENSFNDADNTIEVVFATETPVKRYDWSRDRYFHEILDISHEAINSERLLSGAPLLDSHNIYGGVKNVIGVVEDFSIDSAKKEARAVIRLSDEDDDAKIVSKVKKGIIRNISVGYSVSEYTINEDKEVPEYRATKWTPTEISLVSVPADFNAGVRSENQEFQIANITNYRTMDKKENPNKDAEKREEAAAPAVAPAETKKDAAPVDVAQVRTQAVAEERQRVADITEACRLADLDNDFADKMINDGTEIEQARKLIIEEMAKKSNPAPGGVSVTGDESENTRNAIIDGICSRAIPGSVDLKGNVKAAEYRNMRLLDVAKDRLRAAGENYSMLNEQEIVKRAWATTDFPALLTATFDRILRRFYETSVDEWQMIARQENAVDFRQKTGIKVDGAVSFDEIPEGGEYKESPILQHDSANIKLKKYGRKYSISDIAIINDDLSVFSRLPQIMALGAQQFQSELVWANIIGNKQAPDGKSLFHADHKNLANSASSGNAFEKGGIEEKFLSLARSHMRRQKSPAGHKLGIRPAFLLVPPELQTAAEKMVTSIIASQTGDVNVFSGKLKVLVSDALTNEKAWYLAADPATTVADGIVYAYLNGQPGLRTESRVNWDTDALEVKGSMAFATAVWGWEGWFKNVGV